MSKYTPLYFGIILINIVLLATVSSSAQTIDFKNTIHPTMSKYTPLYFGIILINIVLLATVSSSAQTIDFKNTIHPQLSQNSCNTTSCHGNTYNKLQLSMFSGSPINDYETLTKSLGGRYCNIFEPEKSLLLRTIKAESNNDNIHIKAEQQLINNIVKWLNEGAPYESDESIKLTRISLRTANNKAVQKGVNINLKAFAHYNNNTTKDITAHCIFESQNKDLIAISSNSLTPLEYGEGYISARYLHHFNTLKISLPLPHTVSIKKGNTEVDHLVNKKLSLLNIPPSDICADEVFIRRVFLDLTGRIPTQQQTITFLNNKTPSKRDNIIDSLLNSEGFAEYQTLKWGDLLRSKSEFPSNLWPNAVQAYNKWIKSSIQNNMPYDEFVRTLLLSSGSNFRTPPVNFYRAYQIREPSIIGETSALLFTGIRFECARCHAHPKAGITQQQASDMGAFFQQLKYKRTAEWKEEIVYTDLDKKDKRVIHMFDGQEVKLSDTQDYRYAFANWLCHEDNPYFANAICNRIWYWLNGRGIVNEVDDIRETNPPSNPELLEYLASELLHNNYDLKHIFKLILTSDTYQRSSVTNEYNKNDLTFFSHRTLRRLEAEQLIDAICDITGQAEHYMSKVPEPFTFLPDFRAVQLEDGTITTPFLEMFGRPSRDNSYENNRDNTLNMKQTLHLLNSNHLMDKIKKSEKLNQLLHQDKNHELVIQDLYLTVLNRYPSGKEIEIATSYMVNNPAQLNDLVWALLNTAEFIFNH